jgi:hypothetical protein
VSGASATWTARILLVGSVISAVLFAAGLVLSAVGQGVAGAAASNVGVLAILLTPVCGLIMTIAETRRAQRQTTVAALGVIGVLAVAVGVALVAH